MSERPGPRLARPYALVGGRTAAQPRLSVETMIATTDRGLASIAMLSLERRDIVALCRNPQSIAEITARLRLPYGVTRVLVGDLAASGLVEAHGTCDEDGPPETILEKVLHALRTR